VLVEASKRFRAVDGDIFDEAGLGKVSDWDKDLFEAGFFREFDDVDNAFYGAKLAT